MSYINKSFVLLSFVLLGSCSPFVSNQSESSSLVDESLSSNNDSEASDSLSVDISNSEISVPVSAEHNPYATINTNAEREDFYMADFTRANSFLDAQYRTAAGLISGDIIDSPNVAEYPIRHEPDRTYEAFSAYKVRDGVYTYDESGNFQSYTINSLIGETKTIYYNGGYVTLEDVAAYLFAFAEVPPNNKYDKNAASESIAKWWVYGRVNNSYFSADTDKYKYEPDVPQTDFDGQYSGDGYYRYYEMDFGYTQLNWELGYWTYDNVYNDGYGIDRGPVRFVFTAQDTNGNAGAKYIPIEDRHVFLTTNHYNDFTEYLNFAGGWGITFGWMSAGNEYCSDMSSDGSRYGKGYYEFVNPVPKTSYPATSLIDLQDLQQLA